MMESKSKWRGRVFRYAPLILWMGVILVASSSVGAMNNTSRFIRPFLEWLLPNASPETITIYHGYIRKFAHFAEYAVLAFWAARGFWSSSVKILQKYWFVTAFLTVALVASIDEYNQSFNVLRTSSGWDVLLDISGGLAMILLLVLFKLFSRKSP